MRKIAHLAVEELQSLIYMEAKACRLSKEKLSYAHFMLSTIFNKHVDEYLKVLNSSPEYSMEVLLEQMIKDDDVREEVLRAEGLRTKAFRGGD